MLNKRVIIFLLLSLVFAATHYLAVVTSLYWYFWWFDNVMHFWGGIMLGLGVHALCSLKSITLKPTLGLLIFTLAVATVTWEIFEWYTDLYNSTTYIVDTTKDIIVGFSGGLLAHLILSKRTIKS